MKYPQVRFHHPYLLFNSIRPVLEMAYKNNNDELELFSDETIKSKISEFEDAWKPLESKILNAICSILELEFNQNIIDVYVAPFRNSFSNPMFITSKCSSERAVGIITHELIHRLLTDNTITASNKVKLKPVWEQLFGDDHTQVELYHIPVHATLYALYTDIPMDPGKIENDKNRVKDHVDYRNSWTYVEKVGYEKIINQLKQSYKRINES